MSSGNAIAVFTSDQCQAIVQGFDSDIKLHDTSEYSPNTNGVYNLSAANKYVDYVTNLLRQHNNINVAFQNSFTREYMAGSRLKLHTDRAGLDLTLSVCLEFPTGASWPLRVSNVEWTHGVWNNTLPDYSLWTTNCTDFDLKPGQGVIANGIKYPHWRDNMPENMHRAVYVFYHWNII